MIRTPGTQEAARVRRLSAFDPPLLSALHAECFPEDPWSIAAFVGLLATPGTAGLLAYRPALMPVPLGLLLFRVVAGEAEIITIGTVPPARRAGTGRILLDAGLRSLDAAGVNETFLEVAEDNKAAQRLYDAAGFVPVGRRPGYYRRPAGSADAVVMRRILPA